MISVVPVPEDVSGEEPLQIEEPQGDFARRVSRGSSRSNGAGRSLSKTSRRSLGSLRSGDAVWRLSEGSKRSSEASRDVSEDAKASNHSASSASGNSNPPDGDADEVPMIPIVSLVAERPIERLPPVTRRRSRKGTTESGSFLMPLRRKASRAFSWSCGSNVDLDALRAEKSTASGPPRCRGDSPGMDHELSEGRPTDSFGKSTGSKRRSLAVRHEVAPPLGLQMHDSTSDDDESTEGPIDDSIQTPPPDKAKVNRRGSLVAYRKYKQRSSASSDSSDMDPRKVATLVQEIKEGARQALHGDGGDLSLSRRRKGGSIAVIAARKTISPHFRRVLRSRLFQSIMFIALLCALFLPDMWVIFDRPDNHDLDHILTVVLVLFLCELVAQSVGMHTMYVGTFFFWMDLLGAFSLLLDFSYLAEYYSADSGDDQSSQLIVMRAARVAKLGARAGRFTKLVKMLRFLPGGLRYHEKSASTAKQISSRLVSALSTRVAILIIVMVMIMPMFSMWSYPEQDWSMNSWMDLLEKSAERNPSRFRRQMELFGDFYNAMNYYPAQVILLDTNALTGDSATEVSQVLPWSHSRGLPTRHANYKIFKSTNFQFEFNFAGPNRIEALTNLLLLLIIIIMMVVFSMMLSFSVSRIVLRPLEQLLLQVRKMASTIFQSVTDMARATNFGDEPDDDDEFGNPLGGNLTDETDLLEKVVEKLAVISDMQENCGSVEAAMAKSLSQGDPLLEAPGQGAPEEQARADTPTSGEKEDDPEILRRVGEQWVLLEKAGLSLDHIDSWSLNPLELDKQRNFAAAFHFVGPHNHTINEDKEAVSNFLDAAEAGYKKANPYHNWFHAIDTTHCVYRFTAICSAQSFLGPAERLGLHAAALCHDIGHPGLNNTYLIETSHDLSLRYNDRSPLEHMHCATFFEIVANPKCNIFYGMPKPVFVDMRRVSIEAILGTDMVSCHFGMVKDVQMLYEVNSECLDHCCELLKEDFDEFPTSEVKATFRNFESRKLIAKLFLHLADISSSIKPARLCRIWAILYLDECFQQGDMEKSLGLPVQALNDRNRVNRAYSQVGFIEFLVGPLILATMKILPPLEGLSHRLAENVRMWEQQWVVESKLPASSPQRRALRIRCVKLERKLQGK